MPSHKPSPHRFIAPNPPSTQTPKPKSKSNLRHAISAHTPSTSSEPRFKKLTPAKRFVVAPTQRPHAADVAPRAPDRVEEPDSSPSTDYTPRPKAQRKLERVDSIEEASQSSLSRPPDDDALDIVQTIEQGAIFVEDDDDEILFASASRPKRRRTSPPSPPSPTSHHQATPGTPLLGAAPQRFRFPPQTPIPFNTNLAALTSTTPATTTAATPITTVTPAPPSRPHFILPAQPTSPQKPSRPLPDIFSPSRKTHKYIAHGRASTVQSWIIDAAQTGLAAPGIAWGRGREDGVRLRFRICSLGGGCVREAECFPGSVLFARAEAETGVDAVGAESTNGQGESTGLLLAGQGGARGAGGVQVRVGGVVGVRAPTWEVDVGGERWTVGVDWVLL